MGPGSAAVTRSYVRASTVPTAPPPPLLHSSSLAFSTFSCVSSMFSIFSGDSADSFFHTCYVTAAAFKKQTRRTSNNYSRADKHALLWTEALNRRIQARRINKCLCCDMYRIYLGFVKNAVAGVWLVGYASPASHHNNRGTDGEGHRRFEKRIKIMSDSVEGPAGERQTLCGCVQSFCRLFFLAKSCFR